MSNNTKLIPKPARPSTAGGYVARNLDNPASGIVGHRVGGDPEDESENFYVCDSCGQAVDMRDLGQVFHHEKTDHEPIPLDT